MSELAREALLQIGIQAGPHKSRELTRQDIERATLILTMTPEHLKTIVQRFPDAQHKARLLGEAPIADPIGGSPSDYEKCRIDIQNALLDLIAELKSEGSSKL